MAYIDNMHNVSVASNISVASAVSVAPDISDDTPYRYMYTPLGYIPNRGMSSQAHAYVHAYVHAGVYACVLRK